MTSTGIGRHASRPILDWDDVDMDDDTQDAAARPVVEAAPSAPAPSSAPQKAQADSPWSAMRKLFKR